MRLIFDCRFIRQDHHDGISRFSSELFTEISKLVPTIALVCDRRQLEVLPEGTEYILGNDPTDAIRELFIARLLNKSSPSHVFSPMQTMGSWGRKYRLILTLHDLIYYNHQKAPPFLSLQVRIAWRAYHLSFWPARVLLNRSDAVVTVSRTTKALIMKHKLTRKPVHVIYNAATAPTTILASWEPKSVPGRRQLIYMGSFMPYKNVECLVAAIRELPEHELVLMSKITPERKRQLLVQAAEASDRIIFYNGVSDSNYGRALDAGFALVSASKDEGFGVPLVEAMSYGLPLIVSDIPIFREVAGSSASYFNPEFSSELVKAVLRLSNPLLWQAASDASIVRSKDFNWEDSAKALLEAIE